MLYSEVASSLAKKLYFLLVSIEFNLGLVGTGGCCSSRPGIRFWEKAQLNFRNVFFRVSSILLMYFNVQILNMLIHLSSILTYNA